MKTLFAIAPLALALTAVNADRGHGTDVAAAVKPNYTHRESVARATSNEHPQMRQVAQMLGLKSQPTEIKAHN